MSDAPLQTAQAPDHTRALDAPAPHPDDTTEERAAPQTPEPQESVSSIARKLGPFSFLAVFASFMPAIAGFVLLGTLDPVGNWLKSHNELGLLLYVAAFMILGGLAFLPTYSQAVLGGWAFGFALGMPAALAGFFGGSLIGYGVAHLIGGNRGYKLINEHPKWRAVRDALVGGDEGAGFVRTTLIVALLRMPPNSPFALTNLVMAAAKVPRIPFALGTLIGMTPRTAAAVYIATLIKGSLSSDAIKDATPWWVVAGGILAAIVALGTVGWIATQAIRKVTNGAIGGKAPKA